MAAAPEQLTVEPRPRSQFRARTEHVERLMRQLEQAGDPETRAAALELVQSVIELHGAALERMIEKIAEVPGGPQAVNHALQDELVSSIFLLHSLHPDDLETRVRRGLDAVRPYLKSHGGDCELIGIENGVARLRLRGACGSCASSSATLKTAVEDALFDAAPDIVEIVAEHAAPEHHTSGGLVVFT